MYTRWVTCISQNNTNESILYYEKALAMDPRPVDYYNIACNYARLNNFDKAFENLNKAADRGHNAKANYERDADLEGLKSDSRWHALIRLK